MRRSCVARTDEEVELASELEHLPTICAAVQLKPWAARWRGFGELAMRLAEQLDPDGILALGPLGSAATMPRPRVASPHTLPADAERRAILLHRERAHHLDAAPSHLPCADTAETSAVCVVRQAERRAVHRDEDQLLRGAFQRRRLHHRVPHGSRMHGVVFEQAEGTLSRRARSARLQDGPGRSTRNFRRKADQTLGAPRIPQLCVPKCRLCPAHRI